MKTILLALLKKAGEAIVGIIVSRLLTTAMFEAAAIQAIESLARTLAASTSTDVDDRFVEQELLPRLHRAPGEADGA